MSLFDFTKNVTWGKKGNRIVLWDEEEIKNVLIEEDIDKDDLFDLIDSMYDKENEE